MKKHLLGILVLAIAACANHKDVRPGDNGMNHIVVRAGERDGAERKAIKEANHYCGSQNKHAVFVTEKTNYNGSMDEKDRDTLHNASTAAMIVGNGTPIGSMGAAGYIMSNGKDYASEMTFKCE